MSKWLKVQCLRCNGFLFVKSDWVKPSLICENCQLKAVGNKVCKLKSFVQRRSKLGNRDGVAHLTSKIKNILAIKNMSEQNLIVEFLKDKEIRKLLLQLEKESKIKPKKRNSKRGAYVHIRLLEGGSPGLGKRA